MSGPRTSLLHPRQLEAIVAVAEARSVHAAARRLGVPQPRLSRLVAGAERALGLRLFERSRAGMEPSSSSERVLREAAFALEALRGVSKSAREPVPTIRLGCLPRVMHVFMPHLLARIGEGDVGFRLQVSVGTSNEIAAELQAGRVDVVIGRRVAPLAGSQLALEAERLYTERTLVVCGYANPLVGSRTSLDVAQLARHNWVLPKRGFYSRDVMDAMVSMAGLPPIVPIIESTFESSLSVVAVTRFFTIAPEFAVRRLERLRLVRIVHMKPSLGASALTLQYQRRQRSERGFEAFRAATIAAAKGLRGAE